MPNFRQDILEAVGDEPIEAIVIGDRHYKHDDPFSYKVSLWSEVEKHLDYKYNSGHGSSDCHAICLWTATRVFFIGEYDGRTWVDFVPRHPIDHHPDLVGG